MNKQKELVEKIARSQQSIKDWEAIKSENPWQGGYCDLQISYERERIASWEAEAKPLILK